MAETVTIHLNTIAQTQGIQNIVAGLGRVKQAAEGVEGWLKRAAAAATGMVAGVVGIASVGAAFKKAVTQGVQFNSTVEDARLGIAAILKQFNPQAFANFADAMEASSAAIDLLKKKAVESPASFQQLVTGFQAISGAATGAGIAINDQVELVVLLSQSLAGLGIRSDQLIQESRALITGNIDKNAAVARILEITPEQIEQAKRKGLLFDFLRDRLSAFSEAGKISAGNLSTALSNLGDIVEQKLGTITVPIFEALKEGVLRLSTVIDETDLEGAFSGWSARLADVMKWLFALGRFGVENVRALTAAAEALTLAFTLLAARATMAMGGDLIPHLMAAAKWFGVVNTAVGITSATAGGLAGVLAAFKSATGTVSVFLAAFAGWKAGRFLGEMELMGAKINDVVTLNIYRAMKAWEQFKLSIGQGSPANVDAIDVSIQQLLAPDRRTAAKSKGAPETARPPELVDTLENQRLLLQQNALRIELIGKELTLSELDRTDELRVVYKERAQMIAQLQAEMAESIRAVTGTSAEGDVRFTKDFAAQAREMDQLMRDQADTAGALSNIDRQQLDLKRESINIELESNDLQRQNLLTRGSILGTTGRIVGTIREEAAAIKATLRTAEELLMQRIALNTEIKDKGLISDEDARKREIEDARELLALREQIRLIIEQTEGPKGGLFSTIKDGIEELTHQFDNLGASVGKTLIQNIDSAIRTVADSIWQVIDGTVTWGQVFLNIGRSIVSDLVEIAAKEIFLDGLKRSIAMAWRAFKKLLVAEDVATTNAGEAAKTPALAGNALLASIGSWGVAVAVGVAALGAILASIGAFEKGGVVAGGEQLIRVNERGTEAVLNANATAFLGHDTINALNAGMEPSIGYPSESRSSGGESSGGGSDRPVQINVMLVDGRNSQAALDFITSSAGRVVVADIVREQKTEIGIG